MSRCTAIVAQVIVILAVVSTVAMTRAAEPVSSEAARAALEEMGLDKGICVVLGLPRGAGPEFVSELAGSTELVVYFQSSEADDVAGVRDAARAAGVLGSRVFADSGDWESIHLADNLAGAVLVGSGVKTASDEWERVLHPGGKAITGDGLVTKSLPGGTDDWTHPFHGPDNNPQSTDQIIRAPYLTQFLADPKFCPMPEVSVSAGGRFFKAFGHIAHKENQNAVLNTLMGVNAYNGTILWQRPLKEGFMIHRNTMIATAETLYLADDESCQLIDAATGEVKDRIVIPPGVADGPVWKWMAMEDGVLYALVGGTEVRPETQPSTTQGMGHWPWGMWQGHDYKDPKTNFGFGRNFVAIDPATKKVLWNHREEEYLDSRGVCMKDGRIYFYSPGKFLGCLDAKTAGVVWKNSDADLLEAIGPDSRAQHFITGYSTTTFIKCNDDYLFFAGPQRERLVVASASDGKLLWKKEHGNLQLVLREDGFYAAGPKETGWKLAYDTGEELLQLPVRRACTRATGSADSIFFRTSGGTVRVDVAANRAEHIAPMRPPCQDGVIISNGMLYWGPWMCGCQLSLYGHICLAPAGDFDYRPGAAESRLELGSGDVTKVKRFEVRPGDWPCYRGNNARTAVTKVAIPEKMERKWTLQVSAAGPPTAPVAAGDTVFVGDQSGVLRALDAATGKVRWQAYTSGAIYLSPAVWEGRVFVGSADGRVYAFEAATGRKLWSFRAAPAERWIPAYGKLISTWPVAGGVVVEDGVVYAAAGIAHYDGTHVYAIDAVTGELKWYNDTSGTLSEEVNSGISLQGELYLAGGELRFLAGGVYAVARYDVKTGKCLTGPPHVMPNSRFRTAFYSYYPRYGRYVSLNYKLAEGNALIYEAAYDGARHTRLGLFAPLPPGANRQNVTDRPADARRNPPKRKALWVDKAAARFNSFIVTPGTLLAAGHTGSGENESPLLAAVNVKDGSDVWRQPLPAAVVKGGTALDHKGRIIVSLEDGRVMCFTGK